MACYFQHYAYTAGTVIGTQNRSIMLFRIRVGIRPRTAVPMRKKDDTLFRIRLVGTDNIACFQQRTVVSRKVYILAGDFSTEFRQFICQVISTFYMCFRIGNAWAEVHLCFHILISTVRIELRNIDNTFCGRLRTIACLLGVVAACYECEQRQA